MTDKLTKDDKREIGKLEQIVALAGKAGVIGQEQMARHRELITFVKYSTKNTA